MLKISDQIDIPEIDEGEFYSLRTLKTPGMGRLLARVLLVIIGLILIALFLPWQQNIRGTGTLTALQPENRPQTIETTIAGRIIDWKVREGQFVHKGDTILSLTEVKEKYFDPLLLNRLSEQIEAKSGGLEAKESKRTALNNQIAALRQGREMKLKQASNKLKQAELKLLSDSTNYQAEKIRFANAESTFDRNKSRFDAGNISLTKFQELESKFQESYAKLISSENKWLQSQAELINAKVNLTAVDAEYQDKISKSQSDLAATIADIYDAQGALAKMRNEYANMEIRNDQYQIIAPQSGFMVKALKAGIGETIKEGEAVATIMPATNDKAGEMYIKAMDLPFISIGRSVRIQFDGWPALQFSGWPNVSVGTFGGIVRVIDRVESKPGLFRILVTPNPDEEDWPEQLRMGSGIKGWVMLNDVPIWYELWRQLNGFPPSIYENGEVKIESKK
ncbi:MAG: HlyD family secretion protein [Bacteroidota bacterium]